jgi:hypothetical protein
LLSEVVPEEWEETTAAKPLVWKTAFANGRVDADVFDLA